MYKSIISALLLIIPILTFAFKAPTNLLSENVDRWIQLEHDIDYSDQQTAIIDWSGIGGDASVMYQFLYWMHNTKKQVVLYVYGEAVSAHANIVCQSNYKMMPGSSLIFHSFFIRDVYNRKEYLFEIETRTILSYCISRGILTNQDVDKIAKYHMRVIVNADGSKKYLPDYH